MLHVIKDTAYVCVNTWMPVGIVIFKPYIRLFLPKELPLYMRSAFKREFVVIAFHSFVFTQPLSTSRK